MRTLVTALAALALALALRAETLRVWTGFSRVQAAQSAEGNTRYSDLLVGSNESDVEARRIELVVWLGATDGEGKPVCKAITELNAKLRPQAARPLRFSVIYPPDRERGGVATEYRLYSKVTWKAGGEKEGLVENVMSVSLPAGGVPSCGKN